MTQTKRYEVKGMMEWHPVFKVGRTCVRVSFTGGHLCGGARTSASYVTSDPVVQKLIESSAAFRSGRIAMVAAKEIPVTSESKANGPMEADRTPASRKTVMEFDDIDKASDFLQREKGVPIERIITLEQCVAEAGRLGLDLKIKK